MTLDQLRYFLAAAKFQHVGRAARSVYISPSSVSSAISALERELQTRLFERRSQRIFLTPVGEDVKAWAERLLDEVSALGGRLRKGPPPFTGTYRLAASHFLASRLLAAAWFALQEGNPDLRGDIRAIDGTNVILEILAGRVDLGLCFNPLSHPDLEETSLHSGTLLLAVRKGHPVLRLPPARRLAALQAHPAALYKVLQGVDISQRRSVFERFGIRPRTTLTFDDPEVAFARLRASDCWSFLPDVMIASRPELRVAVRPAGWHAPYQIKAVRHRERPFDRPLRALIAGLRKR